MVDRLAENRRYVCLADRQQATMLRRSSFFYVWCTRPVGDEAERIFPGCKVASTKKKKKGRALYKSGLTWAHDASLPAKSEPFGRVWPLFELD